MDILIKKDLAETLIAIRRFSEIYLLRLEKTIMWLNIILAELGKIGITPDVKSILGFDPWYILRRERGRLNRFNKSYEDVKNGKKKRPIFCLGQIRNSAYIKSQEIESYVSQINYIDYGLKDLYGEDVMEGILKIADYEVEHSDESDDEDTDLGSDSHSEYDYDSGGCYIISKAPGW